MNEKELQETLTLIDRLKETSLKVIDDLQAAIDDIYKERPCGICKHYTGRWNVKCRVCNDSTKQFRPDFEWRGR